MSEFRFIRYSVMEKSVNLNDLWYGDRSILPEWVFISDSIYYCINLYNKKGYVGETKCSIYDRWCSNTLMGHIYDYEVGNDSILQRAIRKYSPEGFEVSLIQSGFNSDEERRLREIYWISELKTYKSDWGYNMTRGGDDTSHINNPKVYNRLKKERGGDYMAQCHTEEAIAKKLENERANHNGHLSFNTDEARERAYKTQFELYGCLGIHLDYSKKRSIESRVRIYGSAWGCVNNPETYERLKKERGGDYMRYCHTPEVFTKRLLSYILELLGNLKSAGKPITSEYYLKPEGEDSKWSYERHIRICLNKLNDLRKLPEWTEELELIFNRYYLENDKLKIKDSSFTKVMLRGYEASKVTQIFNRFNYMLDIMRSNGEEMTIESIVAMMNSGKNLLFRQMVERQDELKLDKRWTDEMDRVISHCSLIDDCIVIVS